jgi:copper homeostasis protein CutC
MNDVVTGCCTKSIESAVNGQAGGVNRIELHQNLEVGGILPFYQDIIQTTETLTISFPF